METIVTAIVKLVNLVHLVIVCVHAFIKKKLLKMVLTKFNSECTVVDNILIHGSWEGVTLHFLVTINISTHRASACYQQESNQSSVQNCRCLEVAQFQVGHCSTVSGNTALSTRVQSCCCTVVQRPQGHWLCLRLISVDVLATPEMLSGCVSVQV